MNTVSSLSDLFPTTQETVARKGSPNELGQDDFLKLMVAQLENQDPTKPMDNFEFLAQISQFSMVSGIQDMQKSFGDFSSQFASSQLLGAANLIGRSVMTPSNVGTLSESSPLQGTIDLPANATSLRISVQDMNGALINQYELGANPQGFTPFAWDGSTASGSIASPGAYRISADAMIDGQRQALSVYTHQRVSSVLMNASGSGYVLGLADGSEIGSEDVIGVL